MSRIAWGSTDDTEPYEPPPGPLHVAVLTLTRPADRENALAAIARFDRAVQVEDLGDRIRVSCSTQRGDTGAYRMHALACAFGVPVHVE
jgi:hypothetical protein